jgi:hypothetical protein
MSKRRLPSDRWRLFLRYAAAVKDKSVARLRLSDLTTAEVLAFLKHTEEERKVSIARRVMTLAVSSYCHGTTRKHNPSRTRLMRERHPARISP